MIERLKKIYYCETCNKKALTKHTIAKHETVCYGNEELRPSCFNDCVFLDKKAFSNPDGYVTHKGYWCNKFDKQVHTKGAEVYGLLDRYPDDFEESTLMPRHCIAYEQVSFINPF